MPCEFIVQTHKHLSPLLLVPLQVSRANRSAERPMSGADMVALPRMNGKRVVGKSRMPWNYQSGSSSAAHGIELEVDDDGLHDGM